MSPVVRFLKRLALLCVLSLYAMWSQAGANYWFDLLTEDAATAITFYGDLFGWETRLFSRDYHLIMQDGQAIGGIAQIEGELAEGDESLWLLALPSMDLDEDIEQATANGAELHISPEETSMIQRFAVVLDPQGAAIMLLSGEHLGLTTPAVNRWIWAELWSQQPDKAAAFYDELTDVDIEWSQNDGWSVGFMSIGGREWASITKPPFEGTPQLWMPYVLVADIEQTVQRVEALGGRVLAQASDNLREGSLALVADPTGAAFIVYEDQAGAAQSSEATASGHRSLGTEIDWRDSYRTDSPAPIGPPTPENKPQGVGAGASP